MILENRRILLPLKAAVDIMPLHTQSLAYYGRSNERSLLGLAAILT